MLMQRSSRLAGQVDSLKLQHKTDLMVQVDLQKQLDNANDNIVEIASHVPGAQIEIVPHDAITVPQTTTTMKATSTTIRSTTSTAKAPTTTSEPPKPTSTTTTSSTTTTISFICVTDKCVGKAPLGSDLARPQPTNIKP